jgi:hypothetical protein
MPMNLRNLKEGVFHGMIETVGNSAGYAQLLVRHSVTKLATREPLTIRDKEHAVLLVPGYLGNASVMHPMSVWCEREGLPAFRFNIGFHTMVSFGHVRGLLVKRIGSIRERFPWIRRLDLVAHSMGGLVSLHRDVSAALRGLESQLVTLGTPFRGTWAALIGCGVSRSAFELLPLHGWMGLPPVPAGVRLLSIAGSYDLLAPPERCEHPAAVYQEFPVDHAGLLIRKKVFYEGVLPFLRA